MLEKRVQLHELYDQYAPLLSPKQRSFFELYYSEDLSLGEISEQCRISRQAVYDHIRRAEELLHAYEEALQLNRRKRIRLELLREGARLLSLSPTPREALLSVLLELEQLERTGREAHGV